MWRWLLAALLALAVVAVPSAAGSAPLRQQSGYSVVLQPFVDVLNAYAAGRISATDAFVGWSDGRWTAARMQLREHADTTRLIRIGAVLYLERATRAWDAGDTGAADTGAADASVARGYRFFLSTLERRADNDAFRRQWYTAAIAAALNSAQGDSASDVIARARDAFPDDSGFRMASGILQEMRAWLSRTESVGSPSAGAPAVARFAARRERLDLLRDAEHDYRAALDVDPENHDARLRLGRVLMLLGDDIVARSQLRASLSSQSPSVVYLAHLFLGRIEEQAGDLGAADAEYHRAHAINQSYQTAIVAMSRVETIRGWTPEATDWSMAVGALQDRPEDPWWLYLSGHTGFGDGAWERLQEAIRR